MSENARFKAALEKPMSAKQLVLSLFAGLDATVLPISSLIAGAGVFDIEASAVRVAINRLAKERILSASGRGYYQIGEEGRALYQATLQWQHLNDRVQAWDGGWFCIHTAHLGRTDRKALRTRHRALRLYGFASLEDGLWVRPSNLSISTSALKDELSLLGLNQQAIAFRTQDFIHDGSKKFETLWDRRSLEADYQSGLNAIKLSEAKVSALSAERAANEVLSIGSAVISILTHDPLLPGALINTKLRDDLHKSMLHYDQIGKDIWAQMFAQSKQNADARMLENS